MRKEGISQLILYLVITMFLITSLSTMVLSTIAEEGQTNYPETSNFRAEMKNEIQLFFHRGHVLDTSYNDTAPLTTDQLSDGENVLFELQPELKGNLEVEGKPVVNDNYGFWIYLSINNPPFNGVADVTINVLENSEVIATMTDSIEAGTSARTPIEVPFKTAGKQIHTFSKGKKINVNINVSTPDGNLPVVIGYDTTSDDGYMLLSCNQIAAKSVKAHHEDNTLGAFYPNLPRADQRVIVFKGSVTDKFGAYDIDNVRISLMEVAESNVIINRQPANYTPSEPPNDEIGYFEMRYTYEIGLDAGIYLVTAHIFDNNNFEHTTTYDLTMANYGVYLVCQNNTGEGYPGSAVAFKVDVHNVGGKTDRIKLTATPDPLTWSVKVTGGDSTGSIPAGGIEVKTIEVLIPNSAKKNERCIVDIRGTSVNDDTQRYDLNPPIDVVAKARFAFTFDLTSDNSQKVKKGESGVYIFDLQNTGSEQDSYTVGIEAVPPGSSDWDLKFESSSPNVIEISEYQYKITLNQAILVKFTLTVTAPSEEEPTTKDLMIQISASSQNISETNKKTITHDTTTQFIADGVQPGEVILYSSITSKNAEPGDSIEDTGIMSISFNLEATNDDTEQTYSVNIQLKDVPATWDNTILPSQFNLDPEDSEDISLIIDIPEIESAGSYSFQVLANYGLNEESSVTFTITIPEVYDVELESEIVEKSIKRGESYSYELVVTNKGNVKNIDIELTYTEIDGWDIEFSKTKLTLNDYGSVAKVLIDVSPTEDAKVGTKVYIDIQAKLEDNDNIISQKWTLKPTATKDTTKQLFDFLTNYVYVPLMVIFIIFIAIFVWKKMKTNEDRE